MILYKKKNTPFIFRFLPVLFNPSVWILSALGAVVIYFAGIEKPPMSYGMYFVAGILALFVYLILHSHWVTASTKLVLIEIVPTGLRIQQLKYDRLDEVRINTNNTDIEAVTHHHSNRARLYELKISDKKEDHIFSLRATEEVIAGMLEKMLQHNAVDLKANERDFIGRYKRGENSVGSKVWKAIGYLVNGYFLISIAVILGYLTYSSYSTDGYVRQLAGEILGSNSQPYDQENAIDVSKLLVGFPKKWFPLFESYRGLVRQQICNRESTISLIEDERNVVWKEEGPLNEWEGVVTDFVEVGERSYDLTVQ